MSDDFSRLDAKINALVYDFERSGYEVILEPRPDQMPIDIGIYRPRLIATKGNGGFIVEVKDHAGRISMDRLQNLADDVAEYPHWRFLLVTLEDIPSDAVPYSLEQLPDWPTLAKKLQHADALLAIDARDAFVLYVWAIFEAALRRRALEIRLPTERLQTAALLPYMYTGGEIPIDDFDRLTRFMNRRNATAHHMLGQLSNDDAAYYLSIVDQQLREWAELSVAGAV